MTEYAILFAVVLLAIFVAGWIMNAFDDTPGIEQAHEGFGG